MCQLAESTMFIKLNGSKTDLKKSMRNTYFLLKLKAVLMLCLKELASYLVNEKWYTKRKTNTTDESKRIIQTAAKTILNEICSQNYETDYYSTSATIENIEEDENYIPEALRQFLPILIKKQLPRVFLGQAMISNGRARSSIVSIPFALGVESDNQFGWLFAS